MSKTLCLQIMAALCWQHVSSRHLVQPNYRSLQQPYYLPYSENGFTYSDPLPYHPPYYQPYQQLPLYSPPGTYYDQRRHIFRPFPGGGVPVLVDYHKRCSNQYLGLKALPQQHQYYYVCKPDCVIFGKCQNLQMFNSTSGQCTQHPPPEYIPTCSEVGRFPIFSDCHLYYKCEENLQPKIYTCPEYMVFSPASKKCIGGNKCTPTQISPRSSYIPDHCTNKFPPCYENGVFRSPSDCSLYYKCELQKNGVYMQTRLRCPNDNFYDLQKHECLPSEQVPCDCIQIAELVYPKPNTMFNQPAVYPAQYDFDSLEENLYPLELTQEEMNVNSDNSESKNDSKNHGNRKCDSESEEVVHTATTAALNTETTLKAEVNELKKSEPDVLSDYINTENDNSKTQNGELNEVAQNITTTIVSSDKTTLIEGSGTTTQGHDGGETTTISDEDKNEIDDTEADVTAADEEIEPTTATTFASKDISNEPDVLITNTSSATPIPDSSVKPELFKNAVGRFKFINKPLPTDSHTKNTFQTPTKTFLPKLATTSFRSKIHEQNLTIITTVTPTATTQFPTTEITPNSDNLETTQVPEETAFDFDKGSVGNESLETYLLDSESNLKTIETTQSSEQTTAATIETTYSLVTDAETPREDNFVEQDEQESALLGTDNDLTISKAPEDVEPNNRPKPRLDIKVNRPIDIHLSVCDTICSKDHEHNNSTTSNRAVFLKWFPNKSEQTASLDVHE